jgi:lipopolysaccharide transport system permease protein
VPTSEILSRRVTYPAQDTITGQPSIQPSPLRARHSALSTNLWRHRALIRQFTWREFRGRYLGSYLGLLWSVATPAAMLCIYTFVFRGVLQVEWKMLPDGSALMFAVNLFGGLLVYNLFAEVAGRSPLLLVNQPHFVRKVVFPVEILPITTTAAALGHGLIALAVVGAVACVGIGLPSWHVLWLPVLLFPYVAFLMGVSWFLAAAGTFWRDFAPAVTLGLHALIFLTPVFYPLQAVPQSWQPLFRLNPLAVYVENTRRVWLWNQPPDWSTWCLTALASVAVMLAGYWWFMRVKRAFADVV